MERLQNVIGQELIWIPTKLMQSKYELVGNNQVLATLDVSNWSSKAVATAAEGVLEIKSEGLSRMHFNIYPAGYENVLAHFKSGWTGSGGNLQMADGRTFSWQSESMMGMKRLWMDGNSLPLVHYQQHALSREVTVIIEPAAAPLPDLSLLVIFGFYLIVMHNRNAAMIATIH